VTGTVPDVRPYLAHADVVVTPLRIARGIQNKVLEAMAMAQPVVISSASATGLEASPGEDCEIAHSGDEFVSRIVGLLADVILRRNMGQAARKRVVTRYSWGAHLSALEKLLAAPPNPPRSPARKRHDRPAPLVIHVVFSFDVGGLENGIVNLLNHMPAEHFRHKIVALTRCVPSFCERVRRSDVEFVSLHKPAGHGLKLYPALFRMFREEKPAIVHTRNLAALEMVVPAWLAGVPVRIHGEHGWDSFDREGRAGSTASSASCIRPSCPTTWRCRARSRATCWTRSALARAA
jgi:hypothetical protein